MNLSLRVAGIIAGGLLLGFLLITAIRTTVHAQATTGIPIKVVCTNAAGAKLTVQPSVMLADDDGVAGPAVTLDPTKTYQTIIGFGGAITDASASVLMRMSQSKRDEVLNAYFGPDQMNYKVVRTHINSCDFSRKNYAYDTTPGDTDLKNFSIKCEEEVMIPIFKAARAVKGADFRIFACPWSPPAWMKTNNDMNHGGNLKAEDRDVYARYIGRYISDMKAEGVDIWGITPQNEPEAGQSFDSCNYSPESERDFIKNFLGPTLVKQGLGDIKIMCFDHNKDHVYQWANTILGDPEAAKYCWGTAVHIYGGDHFDALTATHDKFPTYHIVHTEACAGGRPRPADYGVANMYAHDMIGDLNNWTEFYTDWNIVLDPGGGPNHVSNFCNAPVICDPATDTITYATSFYAIGQFSKFIKPGSVHIAAINSVPGLEVTAAKNLDASIAVVASNNTNNALSFKLRLGTRSAAIKLDKKTIATYVIPAPPDAVAPLSGPASKEFFKIEAEKYTDSQGVQLENNGTTVGSFDAGDWMSYKDLDFTADANAINLVVAAQNDGGTFELRLDAKDGKKIGEYTICSTGGHATWQDITCAIIPVTGTHTLYIVGTKGTDIANIDRISLVLVKAR